MQRILLNWVILIKPSDLHRRQSNSIDSKLPYFGLLKHCIEQGLNMPSLCQSVVKQSEQLILRLMHKAKVKEVWTSCFWGDAFANSLHFSLKSSGHRWNENLVYYHCLISVINRAATIKENKIKMLITTCMIFSRNFVPIS